MRVVFPPPKLFQMNFYFYLAKIYNIWNVIKVGSIFGSRSGTVTLGALSQTWKSISRASILILNNCFLEREKMCPRPLPWTKELNFCLILHLTSKRHPDSSGQLALLKSTTVISEANYMPIEIKCLEMMVPCRCDFKSDSTDYQLCDLRQVT